MTKDEAMKLALEALETLPAGSSYKTHNAASALRQAIEQAKSKFAADCDSPSWCNQYGRCHRSVVGAPMLANCMEGQEPIGWITDDYESDKSATTYDKTVADRWNSKGWPVTALYTAPPKREWVGLTDEEIAEGQRNSWVDKQAFESAVWWAEERLKDKNRD